MPRLRGPIGVKPEGASAWPMLNETLFGDNGHGGYNSKVQASALPWSWSQEFGRVANIGLEIGTNRGVFLRALSERFPDKDFVGIEVRRRYVWRLSHQIARDQSDRRNVRVVWADAKLVTGDLFSDGAVSDVYVTFPDPWWKKRHAKRRLVDTAYAPELARMLKAGGKVWVKTDVPAMAEEISEALQSVDAFGPSNDFPGDELPFTHREKKCVEQGLPIHRFFVERR